jgi:hypothetical protein
MHTPYHLLMSSLFFLLSASSLVCMEPSNNANQCTDALFTESADELYDRVEQKILDTYEHEKREIYKLSMALLFQDIEIGLTTDRWSGADQARVRGRITKLVTKKRVTLELKMRAFSKVHRNFHEALISHDLKPVVGIKQIINHVNHDKPLPPAHVRRQLCIDDIRADLWPHVESAYEFFSHDYVAPLKNNWVLQKATKH